MKIDPTKSKIFLIFKIVFSLGLFFNTHAQPNKYFEYNIYLNIKNHHFINDSLRVHFKTSPNFIFLSEKEILNIKLSHISNNILAYGKLKQEVSFDLIVALNKNDNELEPFIKKDYFLALDTVLDGQAYYFIGIAEQASEIPAVKKELREIMGSICVGEHYLKDIPDLMELWQLKPALKGYYASVNYPESNVNEFESNFWLQMERTLASFLGDFKAYEKLMKEYETHNLNEHIVEIIEKNAITDNEVYSEILRKAEEHQIIMISEDHQIRRHRKFVKKLLADLYNIGYKHLALEALNNPRGDSILNSENGNILAECGYYIQEQNFANLIRKAKELGYIFVSYENIDNQKDRELGQAENLYNKTFAIDSNAKVLVLAGGGHIMETPDRNGKKWMAALFKEKYNIDPLTISQTFLNHYRNIFTEELLLVNSSNFEHITLNSVDYLLLNNLTKEYNSKSDYNFEYLNSFEDDIQVNLYYGREVKDIDDFNKYVPFLTTVLESGETLNWRLPEKELIYLIAFDRYGRQIDFVNKLL